MIKQLFEFIIPRFVSENVAVKKGGPGEYHIVCCEDDLKPGDSYDFLAPCKSISWLGFGWFARFEVVENANTN